MMPIDKRKMSGKAKGRYQMSGKKNSWQLAVCSLQQKMEEQMSDIRCQLSVRTKAKDKRQRQLAVGRKNSLQQAVGSLQ